MCLAIYKPKGVQIPDEAIDNGWLHNPGGGGFCYVRNGKIEISKGFFYLKDMREALAKKLKANRNSPFLIHFRIPTHGDKTERNTHPFQFEHGAGIHNGSIHGTGAKVGEGESDTNLFFQKFSKDMTFENVNKIKSKLEEVLGYNKIVLLYPDSKHIIINEKDGVWDKGVWYSNHTFKPRNFSYGGR